MANRAGTYRKQLSGDAAYSSFVPAPLPPEIDMDSDMMALLIKANRSIATLEGLSSGVPNMRLFVSMYVRKEAVLSSQIEGTQATLEDIFNPAIDKNRNLDVSDVVNYVRAIEYAIERLDTLPISGRLLRETHSVLMEGVRGEDKEPGEFRRSQNWIGPAGCQIKDARYIPPSVDDMNEAVSDLEKYINSDDDTDPLVKAALIHYQFETIHPFLDGNGRIGRMLITLYLIDKKVMSSPVLYISYYLKKYRSEYYDRLERVRTKGDYEQWIKFFLQAVCETSDNAVNTIKGLITLHEKNEKKISMMGRAKISTLRVFHYLEQAPIIDISATAAELKMSYNTAASAVRRLIDAGIVDKLGDNERNRTYIYSEYIEILAEGTEI